MLAEVVVLEVVDDDAVADVDVDGVGAVSIASTSSSSSSFFILKEDRLNIETHLFHESNATGTINQVISLILMMTQQQQQLGQLSPILPSLHCVV